ncbi:MAG: F0F1 ATP synthase subunit gamma [Actinomycetota bacterium]|nr:F0F1 ATP synthase subunit gamma [Actinomycetota bacterium]
MASGQERKLRRRIKSVQSTKKITRAMELIAASRIVKAQQRVAAARPYSEQISEVMKALAGSGAALDHPMLEDREEINRVGFIVVGADRGLAGAYNTQVIRAAERGIREVRDEGKDYGLIISGQKPQGYFRYRGYRIDDAFGGYTEQPSYEDARRIGEAVVGPYEEGELDEVRLVYTRFLSAGSQKVVTSQLLPVERGEIEDRAAQGAQAQYEMEPEPERILEELLPRYVEALIYAALLDAAASEHAARQRAMKAATDNAEELIDTLSVEANKLRQAGITTEIMDIVGGAEALRQASSGKVDYLPDTVLSRDLLRDYLDRPGARI